MLNIQAKTRFLFNPKLGRKYNNILDKCLHTIGFSGMKNSKLTSVLGSGFSASDFGMHSQKRSKGIFETYSTVNVHAMDRLPKAMYGGRHTVSMLPGGGIGPEFMRYVREIFSFGGFPVDFEILQIDPSSVGNDDLENAITSIRRNGVGLKGNIETRSLNLDIVSRNVALRNELDLYVNVLHCVSFPGIKTRHHNIDILLIRQNTEGEYAMLEHESVDGVVVCLKVMTRPKVEKLARCAFNYARQHGRKKITTVHKANIMKLSDGLFLDVNKEISKEFPDIEHDSMIVDNCCMQLVSNPNQFDVLMTTNLYGTIVGNLICGLTGGAGLHSGMNFGDDYSVFEPATRNTGTKLAGKNTANPIAMISAAADMLKHIELHTYGDRLRAAINNVLNVDKVHTTDLGGTASTEDVITAIKGYLAAHPVR